MLKRNENLSYFWQYQVFIFKEKSYLNLSIFSFYRKPKYTAHKRLKKTIRIAFYAQNEWLKIYKIISYIFQYP